MILKVDIKRMGELAAISILSSGSNPTKDPHYLGDSFVFLNELDILGPKTLEE